MSQLSFPEGWSPEGMEFLQKRIHSCASLAVSCVTPLTTSLENVRSQPTLYLLFIGTLNHGRVISYPLGTHPWGIAHFGPLQVGDYSPGMHTPRNMEVQTRMQNPSPRDCIPSGKLNCDTPYCIRVSYPLHPFLKSSKSSSTSN